MAQEDNYLKAEDYQALARAMQIHGEDSLSGLQRRLLGLGPRPMQQEQQEFSPPTTYSAIEPLIDEEEVKHYKGPYQRLKDVTGSGLSEVEMMMMRRLMGED